MDDSKLVEHTVAAIETAIEDYFKHTTLDAVKYDISREFIERLARDSVKSKAALRAILRRSKAWNEDLQAVVINGKRTHDPDYALIHRLCYRIFDTLPYNVERVEKIQRAVRFFDNSSREAGIEAIKELAPNAYRPNKKKSRVFKALCDALGVTDDTAGSEFQKTFAWLADELNSKKIDFKLFLSINPGHFLTMSNPKDDRRGNMLTSCHSFNSTEYPYNNGCTGYARDDVTMIAFTVDDPNVPETLNNRKTSRQLFMYRAGGGLLLQSRLYNTSGGTHGVQKESALYRDLVQRELSDVEGTINLWKTERYCRNKWGLSIPKYRYFGGYEDWMYQDFDARISIRLDRLENFEAFEIGNSGLCIKCGDEITHGLYCEECEDERHHRCDHCGEYCEETWTVHDRDGDEIEVCESCLDDCYSLCEDCNEYYYIDDMNCVAGGRYVCDGCFDGHYTRCDECGDYYHDEDECMTMAYDANGNECYICESCRDSEYEYCEHCNQTYHESLMNTFRDASGDEIRVCDDCLAELKEELEEEELEEAEA